MLNTSEKDASLRGHKTSTLDLFWNLIYLIGIASYIIFLLHILYVIFSLNENYVFSNGKKKIPTKSRISTYHPTIDWAEPNLSFNQSLPCHIPNMGVGSHGINQNITIHGIHRKPPPPSYHNDFTQYWVHKSPKSIQAWMPQNLFTIPRGIFLSPPTS